MKRIGFRIKAILVLVISLLASCEGDQTNLVYELNQPDDLAEEVYEVYSRVINHQFSNQEYIVLQQQTDTTIHEDHCRNLYESDTTDLDTSIIGNYIKKNQDSYNLGTSFDTKEPQVKLITLEELNSYEEWESFHENYPKAKGVLYFSFPGFNSDDNRALFEFTFETGDNQSKHYMVYLKKTGGEWDIMAHEKIEEE
ncbi:MAG: hypothetical protein ACQER7_05525 [Bacteroidota bacterium]